MCSPTTTPPTGLRKHGGWGRYHHHPRTPCSAPRTIYHRRRDTPHRPSSLRQHPRSANIIHDLRLAVLTIIHHPRASSHLPTTKPSPSEERTLENVLRAPPPILRRANRPSPTRRPTLPPTLRGSSNPTLEVVRFSLAERRIRPYRPRHGPHHRLDFISKHFQFVRLVQRNLQHRTIFICNINAKM